MTIKKSSKSKVSEQVAFPFGGSRKGAIRVGIIGGAGYTGGELIRILLNHPDVNIQFIHSRSNAGKLVSSVHHDLVGETDLRFTGSQVSPVGGPARLSHSGTWV